jgi:phosphoribosylglycinamide formyltransferase-1
MKIGVVCSAGGSAVKDTEKIFLRAGFQPKISMVVDRRCGAELTAMESNWNILKIEDRNPQEFSARASHFLFDQEEVDLVALFFSRKVTSELFDKKTVVNVHPSLLPSFPGMRAIEGFAQSSSRIYGTTIHHVSEEVDGGKVISQIAAASPVNSEIHALKKMFHYQKVFLFASLISELTSPDLGKHTQTQADCGFLTPVGLATKPINDEGIYSSFIDLIRRDLLPPSYLAKSLD